jgi:PHP family Zn ribbon phosphoesterase
MDKEPVNPPNPTSSDLTCYRCGKPLQNPEFCSECGKFQQTECHRCGTLYRKALGRCPHCGLVRRRVRSRRGRPSSETATVWYRDPQTRRPVLWIGLLLFVLGSLFGYYIHPIAKDLFVEPEPVLQIQKDAGP